MTEITNLDLAWERINALGGVAYNPIEEAINATVLQALAIIENLGGGDPLPKRAAGMVCCERCEKTFDEASDPHCYCDNPYDNESSEIVCENCRERAYDQHQERLMECGAGPSLIEQQRQAYKIKHGLPS